MDAAERQLPSDHLVASQARLLAGVENLSAPQWAFRESPERWSIADNVEHLIQFEAFITQAIQDALGRPAELEKQTKAAQKLPQILSLSTSESRRLKLVSREAARPIGKWPVSALIPEFRNARARTLAFAAETKANLRSHFFPHIAFGDLDCYQWLLVLAMHTERHVLQIEQVQADAAFPGT